MLHLLKPPSLLDARRIVCVQPHYDDNDIAAGGTLARLAAAGAEIVYVTVTDDLVGVRDVALDDAEAARKLADDQARAGAILGVKEQRWLGYADAGRWDHHDVRDDLVRVLREVTPDFVMTCDPWLTYEAHADHRRCGLAVAEAVMLADAARLPLDPPAPIRSGAQEITGIAFYWSAAPNTTVAIDGPWCAAKHRAIACYETQISPPEGQLLRAALEWQERQWAGEEGGDGGSEDTPPERAERFKVLRPIHLHCNVHAAGT